jgi:SNF2 family DNA or RNA helicase
MSFITKFKFKIEPFRHQLEEFVFHKDDEYRALFWEMGTGKTKAALDKGVYLYESDEINGIMFVAPNGVHVDHIIDAVPAHVPNRIEYISAYWRATARKEEKRKLKLIQQETRKLKIIAFNTDALRVDTRSYNFIKEFLIHNKVLVIVDESSDFKNPKSLRTRGLLSLRERCEYRMIMDGTPITQGPSDIYAPFEFLQPGLLGYKSYTAFQVRYEVLINPIILKDLSILLGSSEEGKFYANEIYKLRLTNKYLKYHDVQSIISEKYHSKIKMALAITNRNPLFRSGFRNVEELYKRIEPHSSRYKKDQCLDLPEKLFETLPYELSPEQRKLYDQLSNDLVMRVTEDSEMIVGNVLTLYMRLQQMLGGWYVDDWTKKAEPVPGKNLRLSVLIDSIKKLPKDTKVIIWARFTNEIRMIESALQKEFSKNSVVSYYGDTTEQMRIEAKDRFYNNPECRFFNGNPKVAGRGLNQLVKASYMYWFSKDFSLRTYLQAIDRIHRPGQVKNCTIVSIVARNTIDEKIIEAYEKKQSIADYITGDYLKLLNRK